MVSGGEYTISDQKESQDSGIPAPAAVSPPPQPPQSSIYPPPEPSPQVFYPVLSAPAPQSTASPDVIAAEEEFHAEDSGRSFLDMREGVTRRTVELERSYVRHYNPKLLFTVLGTGAVFCFICMWSWMTFTPYVFPWFIYPVAVALTVMLGFAVKGSQKIEYKGWAMHVGLFALWNLVLIVSNLKGGAFPWASIPLIISSVLVSGHAIKIYYPQYFTALNLHMMAFCYFTFLWYFLWCFSRTKIPWFIFPTVVWGGILVLHFSIVHFKKRRSERNAAQVEAQSEAAIAGPPGTGV